MTRLEDDRDTALAIGWQIHHGELNAHGFGWKDYYDYCKPWRVQTVTRDGAVIGAHWSKDKVVHVSILPEWHGRWVTRGILRAIFPVGAILKKSDMAEHYAERLGFVDKGDVMVREG